MSYILVVMNCEGDFVSQFFGAPSEWTLNDNLLTLKFVFRAALYHNATTL